MAVDVTQREAVESFVAASADALGGIDILINNVGGSVGKGLMGSTDEEWVDTFDAQPLSRRAHLAGGGAPHAPAGRRLHRDNFVHIRSETGARQPVRRGEGG